MSKPKREADGITHSRPGSVDQQSEDTFPASDSPSFSPGCVGAPDDRHSAKAEKQAKVTKTKNARRHS